ncbi:uncharacterized protein LOC127286131 [Leptopilina boulardi]|uniref:uncharacterized protein LOC127286131 n=1 Tax=Leptopilina boulardi TaxID=63433 RepID=UPI0021F5414F|nr:uncharacterized protein LOC127286131 [Leptopilina boulardi]
MVYNPEEPALFLRPAAPRPPVPAPRAAPRRNRWDQRPAALAVPQVEEQAAPRVIRRIAHVPRLPREVPVPAPRAAPRQPQLPREVPVPAPRAAPRQPRLPREVPVPAPRAAPRQPRLPREVSVPAPRAAPSQPRLPREVPAPRRVICIGAQPLRGTARQRLTKAMRMLATASSKKGR